MRLAWIAGTVTLIAALAIPATRYLRESAPLEMRLEIVTPPSGQPLYFALSPDGRSIAFAAADLSSAPDRLYLRALDTTDAQPIAGIEEARLPFWSPDSRSIGFFASRKLYRIDIAGGPAQALASATNPFGGAWNADGTILFAPDSQSPLFRVPAEGGEAVPATTLDAPRQATHRHPAFLPDGRQFLFHGDGADHEASGLYLGSLDGGAPKRLVAADSGGVCLATDRIIYLQGGTLVTRHFDPARGVVIGDPVTVASSVGEFSVSATGMVAYRAPAGYQSRMAWFDRTGKCEGEFADKFNGPELSPDDRRVTGDHTVDGNRDVWIGDLARGGLTRLTTHPAVDGYPVWSPDGSRIVFHSNRKGTIDLWIKPSSGAGTEELLFETPDREWPIQWSKDGRFLLYQRSDLRAVWDLWALPMTGSDRTPIGVATTQFAERMGEISPDGRFVVYETDESGRPEIVAQAFPESSGRWPVSTGGGGAPRWSADGKEVYFLASDGKLMAVPITTKGSELEAGSPVALFSTQMSRHTFKFQYAVSRDGRFLVNNLVAEKTSAPITVILNMKR
jgi:Tol biopolymer transport system component